MRLPIYLDAKLQKQLERLALNNGKDIGEMVNQLLQKKVEIIEEFKWAWITLTAPNAISTHRNAHCQPIRRYKSTIQFGFG